MIYSKFADNYEQVISKVVMGIVMVAIMVTMNMPQVVKAATLDGTDSNSIEEVLKPAEKIDLLAEAYLKAEAREVKEPEVVRTMTVVATAYSSSVDQCDADPCITANGFNVCKHNIEDTIAANFLKFGTKVRIPEVYGDKIFVVRDRMNKRYTQRIDVWKTSRQSALVFGKKTVKIEIIQ